MDRDDAGGQAPRLEVHRVAVADGATLLPVLTALFKGRADVQLSLDSRSNAVVAVAPPTQHQVIQTLIDQADKGGLAEPGTELQLYNMKNADPTAIITVLTTLFEKQGKKVQLSLEPRSNQLIAFARPEQQKIIRDTVERMKGEERELQIFQLETADATVAETAINRLFAEDGMKGVTAPIVDVDLLGQQLFIRATKEQLAQIRDLLIKMGEASLTPAAKVSSSARTRVIPYQGDPNTAIEELKRVLPQLRNNTIQVVPGPSGGTKPVPKAAANELSKEAAKNPPQNVAQVPGAGAAKPAEPAKTPAKEPAKEPAKPAAKEPAKEAPKPAVAEPARPAIAQPAAMPAKTPAKEPAKEAPKPTVAEPAKPAASGTIELVPSDKPAVPATVPPAGGAAEPAKPSGKPGSNATITITPGEGTITISSDDTAALDQVESMLRTMSQHSMTPGRNMMVFMLKNARASTVATSLQTLYRTTPSGRRGGTAASTIIAIPDERLNALVVYSNRSDRSTIENLIKMLDSAEVPDSLTSNRMRMIPVKNTSASRILQVLSSIYKAQVDSLGVDEMTNSIVVVAPATLAEEVTRSVTTMDKAAGGEPARQLKIIPLHKTNSARVQKALEMILRDTGRRTTTSIKMSSGTSSK
jgi:type II secretory pathway component GspD/PulD (secretin)